MSITVEQVLAKLAPIEPDYDVAATLGPDALPHLELLAASSDILLAVKAISLASMIDTARSTELLVSASQSAVPEIRVQAAWSVETLTAEAAQPIVLTLLEDADAGVRSVALKSSRKVFPSGRMPQAVQQKIAALSEDDPESFIREASINLLK
jgi:HEAT repeat protein